MNEEVLKIECEIGLISHGLEYAHKQSNKLNKPVDFVANDTTVRIRPGDSIKTVCRLYDLERVLLRLQNKFPEVLGQVY